MEAGVHAGAEQGAELLGGCDGREDHFRVQRGQLLQPRLHHPHVPVRLEVERRRRGVFVDLLRHQRAATHHGDEIGHPVRHVRGLEGERVTGRQHGVGFAVGGAPGGGGAG